MSTETQNDLPKSQTQNEFQKAADLINKIKLDGKLNGEDSQSFEEFLNLLNTIEKKYNLSKDELLQKSKMDLNFSIRDFLETGMVVENDKDKIILQKSLQELGFVLPEEFLSKKGLFKMEGNIIDLKHKNGSGIYISESAYDINTGKRSYFSSVDNPIGDNLNLVDLSVVEADLGELKSNQNQLIDPKVQEIVRGGDKKEHKKISKTKEEKKETKVEEKKETKEEKKETKKPEKTSEIQKTDNSKAIDYNNKKYPNESSRKEIFEKLGITGILEFNDEVIQKIKDFQTSKGLKVDGAIGEKTFHALGIEQKTEKKSKKKANREIQSHKEKSLKEKHISSVNLLDEINKLSKEDLLMKYNTDEEFRLTILNSKENFKAFYEKTHNKESKKSTKIDENGLPIEPEGTDLIAGESKEKLSNEAQIIESLKKDGFNTKAVDGKTGVYELDLAGLFDDSELKINPDLTMNFQTSKYEINGTPKEFKIGSIDELKTILKEINDLTSAKNNLNRLNDKNNPDNQFFHADKIKEFQDKIDEIKKSLDAK